jgi:hypothetical protein
MYFVEFGKPASVPIAATGAQLVQQADGTFKWITNNIAIGPVGP